MGDEDAVALENVFICEGEPGYDEAYDFDEITKDWTNEDVRAFFDQLSDHVGDWQGVPVMLGDDMPIVLHDKHPLREVYSSGPEIEVVVGGPPDAERPDDDWTDADPVEMVANAMARDERIVNRWYDPSHNRDVIIFKRGDGTAFAVTSNRPPNNSMSRIDLWMKTMIASDAWDVHAEMKAMQSLSDHITDRQWRHYVLTGAFVETSKRTGLTYIFRRLRPTIVLCPRHKWWSKLADTDLMRCIAVLCLHPIGYYSNSWAGCMVPTDDVLSHLLMMRGDEAYFWRKANQHDPASAEAGL